MFNSSLKLICLISGASVLHAGMSQGKIPEQATPSIIQRTTHITDTNLIGLLKLASENMHIPEQLTKFHPSHPDYPPIALQLKDMKLNLFREITELYAEINLLDARIQRLESKPETNISSSHPDVLLLEVTEYELERTLKCLRLSEKLGTSLELDLMSPDPKATSELDIGTSFLKNLLTLKDPELQNCIKTALNNMPIAERFLRTTKGHPKHAALSRELEDQKRQIIYSVTESYTKTKILDKKIDIIRLHSKKDLSNDEVVAELIVAITALESERMIQLARLRKVMRIVPGLETPNDSNQLK